jgi:hypothetical protein
MRWGSADGWTRSGADTMDRTHDCAHAGGSRHGREGQTTGHATGAARRHDSASGPRRRAPAYGRDLLRLRLAGEPVAMADVVVTATWDRRPRTPHVYVGADWMPGRTDWTCLVGLSVRVVIRDDAPLPYRLVVMLAAEVATVAAPVYAYWRDDDLGRDGAEVDWLADAERDPPAPWSNRLRDDYRRRADAWLTAPMPEVAARAG